MTDGSGSTTPKPHALPENRCRVKLATRSAILASLTDGMANCPHPRSHSEGAFGSATPDCYGVHFAIFGLGDSE